VLVDYGYDDANRLIEVRSAAGRLQYVYDVDGLRVQRTLEAANGASTTTDYVQDRTQRYAQVLEELTRVGGGEAVLSATHTFADELIAETRYESDGTPTHGFIQRDGFGSTRWLTDATGTLTDSLDYDGFGNLLARVGTTEIRHLYRGEAFDSNTGLYYLRARWMDPTTGRFTQQDTHRGSDHDPLSLNKYLYAHGDPANNSDPSGLMTLAELSTAQAIQSYLTTQVRSYAFDLVINALSKALLGGFTTVEVPKVGSTAGTGIVMALAYMCKTGKKRCLLRGVPTLVNGTNSPLTSAHILSAMLGMGSTSEETAQPLPFILVRRSRNDVRPRRGKAGCAGVLSDEDCDEYPYGSSMQGGNENFREGRVSLQAVPRGDNRTQGAKLGWFYRKSGLVRSTPAGIYLNTALLMPTAWIDRDGDWHNL
jgi:RHS repeat-associated protein